MATVAVLGGSVVGSVTALLLARAGHEVTVLDPEVARFTGSDPALVPRPGAPHTVHAHAFMARTLRELTTRLPDVRDALTEAGVPVFVPELPAHLHDGGRPDDHELAVLRARRLTLDRVVAGVAARDPGVTVLPERATGLLVEDAAVTGLATAAGEVRADLVVDAGGRRSPVAGWQRELGCPWPETRDPCDAMYFTRHHRVDPAAAPPMPGIAEVHVFPRFVQLLFLGDNDTAMLAFAALHRDPLLKRLRHDGAYEALLAEHHDLADWRAALTPAGPVFAIGALDNRLRRLVRDGQPVLRGLFPVGDTLAMTNPTRGRGVSMGLAAAGTLADLIEEHGTSPAGLDGVALALDAWVGEVLAVWYREAAAADAATVAMLRAAVDGTGVPGNAPSVELPAGHPVTAEELERAAGHDPQVVRALRRATLLIDDDRRIASPEIAARVRAVLGRQPQDQPAAATPPARPLDDPDHLERVLAPWA
jgi:2-polyprenyl-6-methoxyphenol hydroxylase-like FAD-dependent oxidoreductase